MPIEELQPETKEIGQNKFLEAALEYLRHSVSVIPVKKDKIPYIKWEEFQTRRATEEEVKEWWAKWPDANVGIITGKISGMTVIDVEAGGDISRFPITTTIRTGGGGWHLYYQYHPINNKTRIFPLTDIRGDGGYVVAPPSLHLSGKEYEVLKKINATPFPAILFNEDNVKSNNDLNKLLNETIPEGERNNTATSICGKLLLRFKEYEWETQAWALFQSWNITHNEPPLPEQELLVIFRSISQAERKRQISGENVGEPLLLESGDRFVINVPISDGFAVFEFEDVEYGARNIDCVVRCSIEMPDTAPRKFVQRINILSSSAKNLFTIQLNKAFPLGKTKADWTLIFSQACELLEKSLEKQSEEEIYDETVEVNTQYLIKPLIEEGTQNIFFGAGGSGKALALDTTIPTPSGWTTMGEIKVGDTLFDETGNQCQVTYVAPIRKGNQCYKITFSDGQNIVADADHLWLTENYASRNSDRKSKKPRGGKIIRKVQPPQCQRINFPSAVTTKQISKTLIAGKNKKSLNHAIRNTEPLKCDFVNVPIDPYVLGVWLGDGTSSTGSVTLGDYEIVKEIIKAGYKVWEVKTQRQEGCSSYRIKDFSKQLKTLNLLKNKHVPLIYLRARREQRIALLSGLMDSDGSIDKKSNRCEFTNCNKLLSDAVEELAISLGFKVTRSTKIPHIKGKPDAVCSLSYRVNFRPLEQVFRLKRKANMLRLDVSQKERNLRRYITKTEKVTSVPVRCIAVDSKNHLFLAGRGMIPTHNTYLSLGMAVSLALNLPFLEIKPEKQINTLFIDYENTSAVWNSRITKILNGMGIEGRSAVKERIFYFRTKGSPIYDIKYQLAKVIKRRNIGLIIIDSAALACGGEPENADTANKLSNALNWFKITTLLIAHETKSTDNKDKTPFGSIFWFNCARNIWNISAKQEEDGDTSHIGLFHRKSNNDRISSPRGATIKFGDKTVNIEFESSTNLMGELSAKEKIFNEIREGVHTNEEIALNIGIGRDQVRVRANELKKEGKIVSPKPGVWQLPEEINDTEDSSY